MSSSSVNRSLAVPRASGLAKTLDGKRGKCEGRKALYEMVPEAVLMAKRLRRASPLNGERVTLQRIAIQLAEAGHINEKGKPYNRKSVLAMVNGPRPIKRKGQIVS